jgi:hypothetical protein
MAKRLVALALLLLLLPSFALAGQQYIIPDSNTRKLTYSELSAWDKESLKFIYNEIFARHGYDFISGSQFDLYFRSMPWYTPNNSNDNNATCYAQVSSLEWQNDHLAKEVIDDMDADGTTNPHGKNYLDVISFDNNAVSGQ